MIEIKKKYGGLVIPLVTPLKKKLTLDKAAVEKLFNHIKLSEGKPFILGTTGEAASLPLEVKLDYIKKAGNIKNKRDTLYAGIGSNSLQESVDLAKRCFDNGVDVVVATLPTYYALTDDQMLLYFDRLAKQIRGPLMIYNIPATTHMSIPLRVLDELSHYDNIVGVKDSERSEERLQQSLQLWSRRKDFSYLLGWAARSAFALQNGADGIVPSTANIDPGIYFHLYHFVQKGDMDNANKMQELSDLKGKIYQDGKTLGESLAALKIIMAHQRICLPYVMPPLERLWPEEEDKIIYAYKTYLH